MTHLLDSDLIGLTGLDSTRHDTTRLGGIWPESSMSVQVGIRHVNPLESTGFQWIRSESRVSGPGGAGCDQSSRVESSQVQSISHQSRLPAPQHQHTGHRCFFTSRLISTAITAGGTAASCKGVDGTSGYSAARGCLPSRWVLTTWWSGPLGPSPSLRSADSASQEAEHGGDFSLPSGQ